MLTQIFSFIWFRILCTENKILSFVTYKFYIENSDIAETSNEVEDTNEQKTKEGGGNTNPHSSSESNESDYMDEDKEYKIFAPSNL